MNKRCIWWLALGVIAIFVVWAMLRSPSSPSSTFVMPAPPSFPEKVAPLTPPPFAVDDVVRMKSGGPTLRVNEVRCSRNGKWWYVRAEWVGRPGFNDCWYDAECLELVPRVA